MDYDVMSRNREKVGYQYSSSQDNESDEVLAILSSRCNAVITIPILWISLDIFVRAITGTLSVSPILKCGLH